MTDKTKGRLYAFFNTDCRARQRAKWFSSLVGVMAGMVAISVGCGRGAGVAFTGIAALISMLGCTATYARGKPLPRRALYLATMEFVFLFVLQITCRAQVSVALHVTATPQDKHDTQISFGRLGRHLAVGTDICTDAGAPAVKVPAARVRQKIKMPAGYTLLPAAMAATVVQDAQGSAPIDTVVRVLSGLSGAAGAAAAIRGASGGWGSTAILTGEGITIALQYVFPAIRTHAVLSIATLMLPEMLDFDPAVNGGCVSGIVVVSAPKRIQGMGILSQDILLP